MICNALLWHLSLSLSQGKTMKIITTRLLSSQSHLRFLLNTNKQPISVFSRSPFQQKPLSLMLKWSWQFRQRYTTTTVNMGTLLLTTGSRLLCSSTWQHHAAMNLLSLSKFWYKYIYIYLTSYLTSLSKHAIVQLKG